LSSLQNQKTQAQQEWERQLEWERGKRQEVEALLQKQGQVQPPVREPQSSGDVPLVSAVGVDYTKLRDLLVAKNWKKADLETEKRMLEVAGRESQGWLPSMDVENFPCQDLGTIDKLWVKYSGGKFGFSVQKQIYQDLGGTKDFDYEVWNSFGDKVGWRKGGSWLSYSDLTFSEGHYMGHLPSWRVFDLTFRSLGGHLTYIDLLSICMVGTSIFSSLAQRLVDCNI
jgi:serine/threonine-protein kinase